MRLSFVLLTCALLAACGIEPASSVTPVQASPRHELAATLPLPSAPTLPSTLPVVFSHLPPGTFQVHLHAVCSGHQNYHLGYLPDLVVGPAQTGVIKVPIADFGHGWCVIVYVDAVRNIVLVTQPI